MSEVTCISCGKKMTPSPRGRSKLYCNDVCFRAYRKSNRPEAYAQNQAVKLAASRRRAAARKATVDPPTEMKPCSICGADTPAVVLDRRGWPKPGPSVCSSRCRNRRLHEQEKVSGAAHRRRASYRLRKRVKGEPVNRWTDAGRAGHRRRVAILRAADAETFPPIEIFERDGWICQLCDEPVDRELVHPDQMSASLDHVLPLSRGGRHVRTNAQLAHLVCNLRKNNRVGVAR